MADPSFSQAKSDRSALALREKVADALAHNDACGAGPVSRGEYLADAAALLTVITGAVEGAKSTDLMAELEKSLLRAERNRLRAGISWVRGMCSDGASLEAIDAKLGEILNG